MFDSTTRIDLAVTMTQGAGRVSPEFVLVDLTANQAAMIGEDVANYASARMVAIRGAGSDAA